MIEIHPPSRSSVVLHDLHSNPDPRISPPWSCDGIGHVHDERPRLYFLAECENWLQWQCTVPSGPIPFFGDEPLHFGPLRYALKKGWIVMSGISSHLYHVLNTKLAIIACLLATTLHRIIAWALATPLHR